MLYGTYTTPSTGSPQVHQHNRAQKGVLSYLTLCFNYVCGFELKPHKNILNKVLHLFANLVPDG